MVTARLEQCQKTPAWSSVLCTTVVGLNVHAVILGGRVLRCAKEARRRPHAFPGDSSAVPARRCLSSFSVDALMDVMRCGRGDGAERGVHRSFAYFRPASR